MAAKFRIAVVPGDGVSNEVVPVGLRVLERVGSIFGIEYTFSTSIGAATYRKNRTHDA